MIFQISLEEEGPLIKKGSSEPKGANAYDDVADDEDVAEDSSEGSTKKPVRKAPPLPPSNLPNPDLTKQDNQSGQEGDPGSAVPAAPGSEVINPTNDRSSLMVPSSQSNGGGEKGQEVHERGSHHSYEEIAASEVSTEVKNGFFIQLKQRFLF